LAPAPPASPHSGRTGTDEIAHCTCAAAGGVRLDLAGAEVDMGPSSGHSHADDPRTRAGEAAQAVLAQDRERYRSLFAYHPDAVFSINLEGRYVEANPAALHLTGRTLEELRSLSFAEVVSPEDLPRVMEVFRQVVDRRSGHVETRIRRADGTVLEVSVTVVPVIVADQVVGIHGVAEDVTEANRLRRELEDTRRVAEEANAAKALFLANMSHELRTPLTSILGATEILLGTGLDEEQTRFMEMVHRSGTTLLRLVSDILDFSRLEAGRLSVTPSELNGRALLDEALADAAGRARRKGLEFGWAVDDRVPEHLAGDAVRITQVLSNLVGNAIKFTEKGFVRLRVDVGQRTGDVATVVFVVEDSGPGIPAEQLPSLFEPFTQADPTATRSQGGAGLGLAICHELATLMGGSIQADSRPGEGSTFTFTLPMRVLS
jgi:PAS domain S-box-containing protein